MTCARLAYYCFNDAMHQGGSVRLGGLLMLRMDDMSADLSRREPLNVTAEPGHDLLKTDVFHVVETVRPKDRGDASRPDAADPPLVDLLKLRHPSGRIGLHVFTPGLGRLHVVEHHFRVRDRRYVAQRMVDRFLCQI